MCGLLWLLWPHRPFLAALCLVPCKVGRRRGWLAASHEALFPPPYSASFAMKTGGMTTWAQMQPAWAHCWRWLPRSGCGSRSLPSRPTARSTTAPRATHPDSGVHARACMRGSVRRGVRRGARVACKAPLPHCPGSPARITVVNGTHFISEGPFHQLSRSGRLCGHQPPRHCLPLSRLAHVNFVEVNAPIFRCAD